MKKSKLLCAVLLVSVMSSNVVKADEGSWKQSKYGWWYENADGSYLKEQWKELSGKKYYFNSKGYMVSGWNIIDGKWYYMNKSGAVETEKWIGDYYLDKDGIMLIDVVTPDGFEVDKNGKKIISDGKWVKNSVGWWYQNKNGSYPKGEFKRIENKLYYFDAFGYMKTGWAKVNEKWYHMDSSGAVVLNKWIGDYYVGKDGVMLTDTITPDGYTVDKNGKWDNNPKKTDNNVNSNDTSYIHQGFLKEKKENAKKELDTLKDIEDEKADFIERIEKAKDHTEISKILEEAKKKSEENKYIKVEDPLFLKVLNKNIDHNRQGDERITKEEMKNLKEISIFLNSKNKADFSNNAKFSILGEPKSLKGTPDFKFAVTRGLKSLKGIEYAVNLEKLKVNENEISDISPLKDLTKLKYLELQRNRIKDLKPLENLTNLEFLKLYNNLIEDIEPLKNLNNLTGLDLHYNVTVEGDENNKVISKGITDITPILNLTKLDFLDISANRIKSVKGIEKLVDLKDIDFSDNNVEDYTGLSDFIVPRVVKMYDDENPEGSINFSGQTVDYIQEVEVNKKVVEVIPQFKGIKELSAKFSEVFGDDFNLFGAVTVDKKGITVEFDKEKDKFIFTFSDKFIKENNKQTVAVNLKIVGAETFSWKLNNIRLKIDVNTDVVPEEHKDFYFNIFNKYDKFYNKYSNLTDEANNVFNQNIKPKKDKIFSEEDMLMLKSLTITDKNIDDLILSPLKYAKNLEELKIELNNKDLVRKVKDFSFLKNLPKLKIFYYQNQDSNLKVREDIAKIDFSNNVNLKDVRIGMTKLNDITFLKNLNLKNLSLQDNEISDISAVANMTNLERLDLDNNNVVNIDKLGNLQNLITLYLRGNPVEDISVLEKLKNVEALHLRETNVRDISVLKRMPKLHRLYIDKMKSINEDYFNIVKELQGVNTLFVDKVNLEQFEWLKGFSNREAVDATFEEDKIRIFNIEELEIPVTINKSEVVNGKVSITNPLKDYNNVLITEQDNEGINENITFENNKIVISDAQTEDFVRKFPIYITDETSGNGYGDYGQVAEIGAKVVLKITVVENQTTEMEKNNLVPRKYDLRNVNGNNYITGIKNQFRDGGCRSFASLGALESHIKLKEGIELDLSENNFENRHGFYFQGLKRREGRNRNSDIPYLVNNGPILESDDPFVPMQYNGQPSEYLTREQVDALPVIEKIGVRSVMGFEFLKTVDAKNINSEEDEKLLQIKQAIMQNGAVVSNIYMSHDGNKTFPYSNSKYYNGEKYAYYADGADGKYSDFANHAITIIGWDDNFSKDNFITKPDIDGAWIVKDAQSEAFGENGIFYVSFKSVSMTEDPYVFTDVRQREYDGIYQHDELAFTGFLGWNGLSDDGANKTVLFNKYTANSSQSLEEIGFYTTKPNAEYEVYFIPNFSEFKDEYDSEELDEEDFYKLIQQYKIFSGTEATAGYHTKKLQIPTSLVSNQVFALGIWTKNSDEQDPTHQWDMVIEKQKAGEQGHNAKVNKNETYAYSFEGFTDINKYTNNKTGNACIKGYFKNK